MLVEAFAVAREASWRVLELRHFDVQVCVCVCVCVVCSCVLDVEKGGKECVCACMRM